MQVLKRGHARRLSSNQQLVWVKLGHATISAINPTILYLWHQHHHHHSDQYNDHPYHHYHHHNNHHDWQVDSRQYKPRFECMEQCYASYTALSPHHSLARYCIQVGITMNMQDIWFFVWDSVHSVHLWSNIFRLRPPVPTPRLARYTRWVNFWEEEKTMFSIFCNFKKRSLTSLPLNNAWEERSHQTSQLLF